MSGISELDDDAEAVIAAESERAPAAGYVLPLEIILHILGYIPRRESSQGTLWTCCLISRAWYAATVPLLYRRPYLSGRNFLLFVRTVCPSKNAHVRKSELSGFVQKLDMGSLVHDGSKSLTARLLGRLKGNLHEFVAPQASFALNSFAALAKCEQLSYLDLSLISASISLRLLFRTLAHLVMVKTLFFPRTASHDRDLTSADCSWPPNLFALHLAGGMDDRFFRQHLVTVPETLKRLSIQHCPQVHSFSLQETLIRIGPQLEQLTIRHPMNRLQRGALDPVLTWCSNLKALRISADYVTDFIFDAENVPKNHPLQILDFDCSPSADSAVHVSPSHCYMAVAEDRTPDLRSVRVSNRLAWTATKLLRQDVSDLAGLLEDNEAEKPLGVITGVWTVPD